MFVHNIVVNGSKTQSDKHRKKKRTGGKKLNISYNKFTYSKRGAEFVAFINIKILFVIIFKDALTSNACCGLIFGVLFKKEKEMLKGKQR